MAVQRYATGCAAPPRPTPVRCRVRERVGWAATRGGRRRHDPRPAGPVRGVHHRTRRHRTHGRVTPPASPADGRGGDPCPVTPVRPTPHALHPTESSPSPPTAHHPPTPANAPERAVAPGATRTRTHPPTHRSCSASTGPAGDEGGECLAGLGDHGPGRPGAAGGGLEGDGACRPHSAERSEAPFSAAASAGTSGTSSEAIRPRARESGSSPRSCAAHTARAASRTRPAAPPSSPRTAP